MRRAAAAQVLAAISLVAMTAAAAQPQAPGLGDLTLAGAGGTVVRLQELVAARRLTVVVFYSATCPCFAVHRERLDQLAREMAPRGVALVVVDSERHAAGEARPEMVPGTQLPVLRDEGGRLARRLGAQYATESFVFDGNGQLRYRGGIDDQRKYLGSNPKLHLRDALLRLLGNDAPAYATAKALGCALRLM